MVKFTLTIGSGDWISSLLYIWTFPWSRPLLKSPLIGERLGELGGLMRVTFSLFSSTYFLPSLTNCHYQTINHNIEINIKSTIVLNHALLNIHTRLEVTSSLVVSAGTTELWIKNLSLHTISSGASLWACIVTVWWQIQVIKIEFGRGRGLKLRC